MTCIMNKDTKKSDRVGNSVELDSLSWSNTAKVFFFLLVFCLAVVATFLCFGKSAARRIIMVAKGKKGRERDQC